MSDGGGDGFTTPRLPRAETVLGGAEWVAGEYRAFGVAADDFSRHVAMLEVRRRTGDRLLFAYHTLGRAEWNPSRGIILFFGDATVTLAGRNLGGIFAVLREQTAAWVQEADRAAADLAPPATPVVESIAVEFRAGMR